MAFNISYVYEIINKASAPLKKIARSQKDVAKAAKKAGRDVQEASRKSQRSISSLSEVAGKAAGVIAAAFAVALPVRQAIAFEAAMADVAKVVEFKEPDGLKKMAQSIKKLSTELPVTQVGLAEIVAAGGQLGVPAEKLAEFATRAAKMSIAFDILPAAAGEAMAKLSNIFNIPIEQMERVGDAINFVSNNAAASAAEIVTALKTGAGAGARALGLTAEQAIALSTAFIAQGLSASEAGTRVTVLARNLTNAKKTTKILGAGFTSLVKKSPQVAITKLLDAIAKGRIPNEKLNELLGETVNDFTLLAKNGKKYAEILGLVADKTKFAGSMQKEFESRAATTDNQLILLGNSVRNIGINLGSALLPAVNDVAEAFSTGANLIGDFFAEFPNAAKVIGGVATGLLVLKGVMLAVTIAQFALNAAMIANPIGLLVAAIAAAVGVAIVFSDEISALVDDFLKFSSIGKSVAEFFGVGETPKNMSPGAQEVSGKLGIDINLSGNTKAVKSAIARPIGKGNLGMNMATAGL